ncbi:MAG: transporter [Balneolaceae bacterium]|jgi:hypothetical protein
MYPLYAQELTYSGNMQYAGGSYYFTEPTYSFYLINGITLQNKQYSLGITVPFVIQNSPWISYSQSGYLPTGGPQHGSVGKQGATTGMGSGRRGRRQIDIPDTASFSRSSFSDPTVSAGISIINRTKINSATNLRLMGNIKIPLADPDRGYGTGAWDGGLGTAFTQRLKSWFLMLNLMYWWFGDMPDLALSDALSYGAGIGKSFSSGKWMLLGSLNGMTRIITDTDPPLNVGGGVNYAINASNSISGNASFGLSESSADFVFGIGWQLRLN